MNAITPLGEQAEANVAMIEHAVKIAIDALRGLGVHDACTVLVGGGSFDEGSALAVGADAYCRDLSLPLQTMAGR